MRPLGGRTRKHSSPTQEHRSPFADDRFATRMQSFRISPGHHPEILPRPDAHDDPSPQSIPNIEAPPIGVSVRCRFGVRFPKSLPLLRLTGIPLGIDRHRVRHKVCFGHREMGPSEKRFGFLSFPTHKQRGKGTHNPLVEGSSPSGPTIFFKDLQRYVGAYEQRVSAGVSRRSRNRYLPQCTTQPGKTAYSAAGA